MNIECERDWDMLKVLAHGRELHTRRGAVCRGLIPPCGPTEQSQAKGERTCVWKLRGFRGLRLFFTCFHAFFTGFSRASAVVFVGCAKTGCFFIFLVGRGLVRSSDAPPRGSRAGGHDGRELPASQGRDATMCPHVLGYARVCPLAIIFVDYPRLESRSNAPRSGREGKVCGGLPTRRYDLLAGRSAWCRLGPDNFFRKPIMR